MKIKNLLINSITLQTTKWLIYIFNLTSRLYVNDLTSNI